ncbi:MAG: DUF4381 domain-containing protein [Hyphomicrobiaceae bacterium]|nr:DUF4381 domain-containing protein [Hyphomicrobiaceae bacterium]
MADSHQTDPLAGLIDIPLPPEVSLWPQTWPSRILLAVVVVGLIYAAVWSVRRWHANRYRREALSELKRIEASAATSTPAELSAALASLVRRTAVAAFPRDQIAPLTGSAWLSFLDRTDGRRAFSEGPGRALEISAYRPAPTVNSEELINAVRSWIKLHSTERAS